MAEVQYIYSKYMTGKLALFHFAGQETRPLRIAYPVKWVVKLLITSCITW